MEVVTLVRRDVAATFGRSLLMAACLALFISYMLYAASPGLWVMEICEILSVPSAVMLQLLHVRAHPALFETMVNCAFYSVVIFSLSVIYKKIKLKENKR
jgi:hypothetical protein